jgi:hypothetical protein
LIEPTGNAFLVRGEGFEPGEEVKVPHRSEDEVMEGSLKKGVVRNRVTREAGLALPG